MISDQWFGVHPHEGATCHKPTKWQMLDIPPRKMVMTSYTGRPPRNFTHPRMATYHLFWRKKRQTWISWRHRHAIPSGKLRRLVCELENTPFRVIYSIQNGDYP